MAIEVDVWKRVPVREQEPQVRAKNFEEVCYGYNEEEAKARSEDVADGQQVEIPVLRYIRNVGTQKESVSRERKDRCKHRRRDTGKSVFQSNGVTRSEQK